MNSVFIALFSIVSGTLVLLFLLILPMRIANKVIDREKNNTLIKNEDYLLGKMLSDLPTVHSYGEVLLDGAGFSKVNKTARLYEESDARKIKQGDTVLVVKIEKNVAYVMPYEPFI